MAMMENSCLFEALTMQEMLALRQGAYNYEDLGAIQHRDNRDEGGASDRSQTPNP